MFQCDCPPDDCAGKVERYLGGDQVAGNQLAEKFTGLVRSIVRRVLGPERREEHDDACQAVFLRVFSNLEQWGERCPFCKWLAVVAARRAIDVTRLSHQVQSLPPMDLVDPKGGGVAPETMQTVQEVVAGFPDEWQQLWTMWTEGASREVMAKAIGKSVRTVHYWLSEMLEQIRNKLDVE